MTFDKESYAALCKLQTVCLRQNIPFASYRLPLNREIITVVQHHSMPERLKSLNDLHEKTGFVVSPFTESPAHETFFLQPDCVFFSNNIAEIYIDKLAANDRFIEIEKNKNTTKTTTSEEFIGNVNKAVSAMKAAEFQKVVLSKLRVEQLPDDFQPEQFFLTLCRKYPHAFVYIMQLPEVGCWIGATPEPLLTIENGTVKTVSLAGTQVGTELETEDYHWSSKEIEEQGIVTNFIEQTLRSLHIADITRLGPENYRAANLIHLKTAFEFPQAHIQNRFSDLLKALHPTPSVGGLPKDEARNFILTNEQHDRGYYTGFFGPVNINEKSAVYVNLRCLQLFDNNFVLYSGAGITSSSVAEKEWEETDNKMLTLMNVMKNS
ncbi:MAG: isochorismate synthase [Paludibacter sp.]|jgi:isochorismate synthase|nr:isochorismate synthase [Paludibacter sp.]